MSVVIDDIIILALSRSATCWYIRSYKHTEFIQQLYSIFYSDKAPVLHGNTQQAKFNPLTNCHYFIDSKQRVLCILYMYVQVQGTTY